MTTEKFSLTFNKGADKGRYIAHGREDLVFLVVSHAGKWQLTIYSSIDFKDVERVGFHDLRRLAYATAQAYAGLGPHYVPADHGGRSRLTEATIRAYDEEAAR